MRGSTILSSGVADPDVVDEAPSAESSSGTLSPTGMELTFAEEIMVCQFGSVLIFCASLSFYGVLDGKRILFLTKAPRAACALGLGNTPRSNEGNR